MGPAGPVAGRLGLGLLRRGLCGELDDEHRPGVGQQRPVLADQADAELGPARHPRRYDHLQARERIERHGPGPGVVAYPSDSDTAGGSPRTRTKQFLGSASAGAMRIAAPHATRAREIAGATVIRRVSAGLACASWAAARSARRVPGSVPATPT